MPGAREAHAARIEVYIPESVIVDAATCFQLEAVRDEEGRLVLATVEGGTLVRLVGDGEQIRGRS